MRSRIVLLKAVTTVVLHLSRPSFAAELTVDSKDMPRVPASEPAAALKTFSVKPGFHLELAAHEPLVVDPVTMCFDERGRLFVVEMIDYSERREEDPHLGRVRMLTDTDGDGRFDEATVYADKLPWPTAVVCYDGGVFVGATPDIIWCKDQDDDGKADERKVVFTGFAAKASRLNVQALFNSFQWGLDNRIHGTCGTIRGNEVTRPDRPDLPAVKLDRVDFSFDPRKFDIRPENGGGQYGMSFDSAGRKFMCSNSDHAQMAMFDRDDVAPNSLFAMPSHRVSIAADGRAAEVFRLSPDEPWRVIRTRWRISGVVRGPVEGGGRVSGYFTGATGLTVFQGDAYGPDFSDNLFVGDAGGNLVHRKVVDHSTLPPVARRPADESDREFIASTDNWFRPVHFANGPDGCLYIADMYRETIEHPWSLPEPIKQHLDLNSGNDRGRIYRVAKNGFRHPSRVDPGRKPSSELVTLLDHGNGWHRSVASRLLYQRGDAKVVKRAWADLRSLGRIHALHLLDSFGELDSTSLLKALNDADERVRWHGLKLLGEVTLTEMIQRRVARLAEDPSLRVRYQLALALGRLDLPDKARVLRRLLERDGDETWVRAAALNAVREGHGELFAALSGQNRDASLALARMAGASGVAKEIAAVLNAVDRDWGKPDVIPSLASLNDGLRSRRKGVADYFSGSGLAKRLERLKKVAASAGQKVEQRLEAIKGVQVLGYSFCGEELKQILKGGSDSQVRKAAIEALLRMPESAAFAAVLDAWSRLDEVTQRDVIRDAVSNRIRARALLAAVGRGEVKKASFDAAQVDALRSSRDKTVAKLAADVFGAAKELMIDDLMADFKPSLTLSGRAEAGKELFAQRCVTCHRANGEGHALGPDLVTVKTKGRENLLLNILNPNAEVAPQFMAFEVETYEDESFTAVVGDETPTHVTLKMAGGITKTLPRKAVKGMRSNGRSLMPEGLQEGMTAAQMADLLRFIETAN